MKHSIKNDMVYDLGFINKISTRSLTKLSEHMVKTINSYEENSEAVICTFSVKTETDQTTFISAEQFTEDFDNKRPIKELTTSCGNSYLHYEFVISGYDYPQMTTSSNVLDENELYASQNLIKEYLVAMDPVYSDLKFLKPDDRSKYKIETFEKALGFSIKTVLLYSGIGLLVLIFLSWLL